MLVLHRACRGNVQLRANLCNRMKCVACEEALPKTAFSKSMLKKHADKRRCMECVAQQQEADSHDEVCRRCVSNA